jgi:putative DNA methylase
MDRFDQLFSDRQLVALDTFSDLVQEAILRIEHDAVQAGLEDDGISLESGGLGARAYAEAVGVYLSFSLDKGANYWSSICAWSTSTEKMISTFGRQAIPMVWDFAEANPFSDSSGNWNSGISQAAELLERIGLFREGEAAQADAAKQIYSQDKIVSTDPPYFDNVPYADLSDFFYVWLRRTLRPLFQDLFATVSVPKAEELVAFSYRHHDKVAAETFFLSGMKQAMKQLAEQSHCAFPVTIYYAFKQTQQDDEEGTASTGWDTFLDAVIWAGFGISGTWPMRTEYTGNLKTKRNALASSIVLACRKRPPNAPISSRREFTSRLRAEIPSALKNLQNANIAPVDLAQAATSPGMAIFTQYEKVLDAEGNPLSVRDALALINQTLDETIAEQEGDYDAESRWALAWFEQYGFTEGEFGVAETLSKAKDTSIQRMATSGILVSGRGEVRLLKPSELDAKWDPQTDTRLSTWEMVHQVIRILENDGEEVAAETVRKLGSDAESARELCYRLYTICERKKRAQEALSYNSLVQSWPEIERLAHERDEHRARDGELFEDDEQ